MRLLPLQIDMYLLAGEVLPFGELDSAPLADRLHAARELLVEQTGCDFGFDLQQWHNYLVEHETSGYCWNGIDRSIAARILEAEADPEWRKAVTTLGV